MITDERIEERSLRRPPALSADQTVLLPNGGYPAQAAPLAKREASAIPAGSSTPSPALPQRGRESNLPCARETRPAGRAGWPRRPPGRESSSSACSDCSTCDA